MGFDLRAPRPAMQLSARFFVGADGVAVPRAIPVPPHLRMRIYERDGRRCQECGRDVTLGRRFSPWEDKEPAAVDHTFPRARGGQNTEENLRLLCMSCNASKGAR